MSRPELSIVVPTLNEAANIRRVLEGITGEARRLGIRFEALVVDGPSKDATAAEAQASGALVLEEHGGGFGAAVRRGLREAKGKFVLLMDADGSHPERYFEAMWRRRAEADLVIGSRLVEGGGMDIPYHRRILTRILNRFFRSLFRLPALDCSSGYRLYRRSSMEGLRGIADGFDVQQENLIWLTARGGRVVEVAIHYVWRREGESKARILKFGLGYLRLAAKYRPVRA